MIQNDQNIIARMQAAQAKQTAPITSTETPTETTAQKLQETESALSAMLTKLRSFTNKGNTP